MSTKQPQHCAHVAAYFADRIRLSCGYSNVDIFGYTSQYSPENSFPPDHRSAVESLKRGLVYVRAAIKEFNRAGGVCHAQ